MELLKGKWEIFVEYPSKLFDVFYLIIMRSIAYSTIATQNTAQQAKVLRPIIGIENSSLDFVICQAWQITHLAILKNF